MCSDRAQLGKGEGAPNETLLVQGGLSGIGVDGDPDRARARFSRVRYGRVGRKVPRL